MARARGLQSDIIFEAAAVDALDGVHLQLLQLWPRQLSDQNI